MLYVSKKFDRMGFCNLYCFSLALLAKQGWRFLTLPKFLSCRIFKSKNFPIGGFLNSMEGASPSFNWKSIHKAKVVIFEGIIWWIGNINTISVFHDPWVNDDVNFFVDTAPFNGCDYCSLG